MGRLTKLVAGAASVAVLASCGPVAQSAPGADVSGRRIRVVATIGMITDVVENIGGERVEVAGLMGAGIDPHVYKASEGDVVRLADAAIVFYNGLHLEAAMGDVFEKVQGRVQTVAVTDYIDRSRLMSPPAFEGNYDPHVWFDVAMWIQSAERIRDALIELDPSSARLYRSTARAYVAKLEDLDRYVREQASRIPADQRVLITAHDAFKYFGRAYGFEVRGLQGISIAAEAGTADVASLADFIFERRIPAVFVETSVPERFIGALEEAVEARGSTSTSADRSSPTRWVTRAPRKAPI